jgi:hypothetical protein
MSRRRIREGRSRGFIRFSDCQATRGRTIKRRWRRGLRPQRIASIGRKTCVCHAVANRIARHGIAAIAVLGTPLSLGDGKKAQNYDGSKRERAEDEAFH